MSRIVRSQSIGVAVCLSLLACGMGRPELPADSQGSPVADAAPPAVQRLPDVRPASAAWHRALLVGINDYSAAPLAPAAVGSPQSQRFVPNLNGAVNDVQAVREMLLARYGFAEQDILVLTDQAATRAAVLKAIEKHLTEPAGPGDLVFFYWSGHGSQVANSLSDEPDKLDETIVPADSLRGAPDIRDKELRSLFNRILDRGAHLTVVLDSCHSASGVRGLPVGARFRSAEPNPHDIRDGSPAGPRPDARGALVFSAAQDADLAWETWDEQGKPHGAFSLALVRALRDSVAGEPAEETFLRARARLQAEKRFQEPVLAGVARAREAPFLGQRAGLIAGRTVVAVEHVQSDGTVLLQGGLANGLTVGSELQLLEPGPEVRIQVTKIHGFSRCEGRVLPGSGRTALVTVEPGDLAEIVQWTALPGVPLRVWMATAGDAGAAAALAQELSREAPRRGIRWVEDPTHETPTHVLRWHRQGWELLAEKGIEPLGPATDAGSVLARIKAKKPPTLFVQLPAPAALVRAITLGPATEHAGVETTDRPEEADYVLAGRLAAGNLEYAWLRPGVGEKDRRRTSLPVGTAWHPLVERDELSGLFRKTGLALEDAVLRLRKIHAWLSLETPPGADSHYKLALRRQDNGQLVEDGVLVGQEEYSLVLRAREARPAAQVKPRYFYVFVIDSFGKSILLLAEENRLPAASASGRPAPAAPAEISLGRAGVFRVTPPYGVDTYFLLTSDEPIPNPWILEWDAVRIRGPMGQSALEELLSITGGTERSVARIPTPAVWSVERKLFESVPPDSVGRARREQ